MTREEMERRYLKTTGEANYEEAQNRIKEAMQQGKMYVYLPRETFSNQFSWWATSETISRLRDDGFDIDEVWQPYEYWSIEWYNDEY